MNIVSVFLVFILCLLAACTDKAAEKKEEKKEQVSQTSSATTQLTREDLRAAANSAAVKTISERLNEKKVVDLKKLSHHTKNSKIVRRKVSDFYALHLGLPHVKNGVELPDSLPVSFDANMASFWKAKVSRDNVSDSTLGKAPEILERYLTSPREYTTLTEFIKRVDTVVGKAKKSLDWQKLCKRYSLADKKCAVLQAVVSKLGGKDFVAYGITELLPNNPELNVLYLDMLLRNAGVSYVMNTPAMHDDMLSLGFYQFTSFSVRKDDEEVEGASVVNGFVKDGGLTIPDSVVYLKGDDHHVAAVYFAVHNLAKMIAKLSDKGVLILASKHQNFQDEMVMFIAAAHHLPSPAWKETRRWVEGGMKGDISRSYSKANKLYALKTHGNLIALYKGRI